MEFVFTLKYQLSAQDCHQDNLVTRLSEAACDDALISVSQAGRLSLAFTRRGEDAEQVLHSALNDVRRVLPGARLIEAGPDLVGLTDVAGVVGVSRQNMRKLMLTHPTSFPAPMHEGNASSVWHLADVLNWMKTRGTYDLDPAVMAMARAAMQVNLVKESLHIDAKRSAEWQPLVGASSGRAAAAGERSGERAGSTSRAA